MIGVLLLLAQALLAFGLCMAAFRLRATFGMAPVFFTLGALEYMKYFAVAQMVVNVPHLGNVFPGSVVFYVSSLAVALVVYVREGLAPARQLMWAMLYVNFTVSLISVTFYKLVHLPNTTQLLSYDPELFSITAWWNLIGTLLLVIGIMASIVLYNALGRLRLPFFLRSGVTMVVIVAADSVLFQIFAQGIGAPMAPILFSNMIGKIFMAFVYAGLAHVYLHYVDRDDTAGTVTGSIAGREVVAALTYQRQIADLERELQRDPLTGALNRRYLEHALPEQIDLDSLRGESTSLLLLDLDRFKSINDTYGHAVGDEALKHAVAVMSKQVRRGDSVVRMGGEEFVVLLPGTGSGEAASMAERICETLSQTPMPSAAGDLTITATVGVAIAPTDGASLRQLLKIADDRMYLGKRGGRNRVVAQS
jgi:diguanylate cyclase (GGDEF)-like protein